MKSTVVIIIQLSPGKELYLHVWVFRMVESIVWLACMYGCLEWLKVLCGWHACMGV